MKTRAALLMITTLVACASPRASAPKPAAPSSKRIVLHAARALVPRTGAVIAPAFVEIENGVIANIGPNAPASSDGIRELGDATILPGFIDAHTHLLTLTEPDNGESMVAEVATMSDGDRALRGVKFGREMLASGFTTVRDLGNSGRGGDVSLKRAIQNGWVFGPTMIVSTRALSMHGGQFTGRAMEHDEIVEHEYAVVRSPDDARAHVLQALKDGADVVKLIVDSDGRMLTLEEVRAAVETAHAAKRKVAAHVLTRKAAALAVAAGCDSLEHGYDIDDATLAEMAKKKIALVATDYPLDYYVKIAPAGAGHDAFVDAVTKQRAGAIDRLARAKKHKVTIVFGSDAYMKTDLADRGKEAALVFRAFAESGLTPLEIVQSATSNAADLLDLPPKTTMERGSPADLVAVQGDPTKDAAALTKVTSVTKAGRVVDVAR